MQDPGSPARGRCDQVQDHRPVDRPGLQVGGPQHHCTVCTGLGREEGWRALYKGLVPKIMRLGPGGAIMLLVYEKVLEYLTTRFPD